MSTFVKKVTSAVAGLAILSSIVTPIAGVSAANLTAVEAANELSSLGIIVDQSANPADYRTGDNLPRREAVKVMMNLSTIAVVDNCDGDFNDLSGSDWACKYAETALDNGMVAGNASFRPNDLVSKIEALKMVFQGRDLERDANSDWRAGYVSAAVSMGIADASFTDYDAPATRGQMFIWAAEAIKAVATDDGTDPLCDLLGICDDGTTDPVEPTTPTTGGDLQVSVSPSTPASATIPGGVNGLAAAAFDFTAGSADVTVSQISVKRTGLSDEDTLENLAVFTAEGRVSNAKSDNQDNDTTAQINLDDGGVVIMAGETKTLVVVVDVADITTNPSVESDEFALELVDVVANGDVSGLGARGNTMRVGSVNAPTLEFTTGGSVADPTLGEVAADIFEFEIDNTSDEDVEVETITFEGSSDAEDNLRNFELLMGNDVVATTAMMKGDYLTFNLGGLIIEEDKKEDFTVRADVVDGAGDTIQFRIDEKLDVTANSTKFAFGASVNIAAIGDFDTTAPITNALPFVTIEAGELTFVEMDAAADEIREDKDNVEFGSIKITNVSGQSLEMETFGVTIEVANTASGSFIDNGAGGGTANDGLQNGTEATITIANAIEDVELYNADTGSSYELTIGTVTTASVGTVTTATFTDNNIDLLLAQGTTEFVIRADTAEDIANFDSVSFDVSVDIANNVRVVETSDDEEVTDKTPSSLSFNTIDGSESGARVSLVPLSNTDVVRGADDVVALQFEVEAEEVSDIVVDEMTVTITATGGAAATNQQIADVKLYKGSVSAANLLDEEGGSNLGTGGDVTFDDMGDVTIAANATTTFVVTVSFVDGADAVSGSDYVAALTAISIEDDENDDVTVNVAPIVSARNITVNAAGLIQTLAFDDANEDNEFDKQVLAGDSAVIASFDVRADNEEIDVETVTFTLSGATGSLKNSIVSATLLLDGVAVDTNTNGDITHTAGSATGTVTFENISGLVLPETTSELALQLNTANIGEDFVGEVQTGLVVTDVVLSDADGVESGKNTAPKSLTGTTTKTLDIVTAIVTPSVVSNFGTDDQTAELRLVVNGGSNTNANGDAVQADLTSLVIEVSSLTGTGAFTVFNGNGTVIGSGAVMTGANPITIASDSIGNDNEIYRIETTAEAIYRLSKAGVAYTTDGGTTTLSTKLENTLELGQYADSN